MRFMGSTLDLTGYKLTFDDEFNSFNWNSNGQPGNGTWQTNFYFGGRSLPSNGEQETYSDPSTGTNPFSITPSGDIAGHSQLDIQANPAAGGGYTSGLITTEPSFSQTYGYFDMRAELPAGKGLWPAFWMLPTDKSWPPEIDALEAFGGPNASGEGGTNQAHVGVISSDGSQNNGGWQTVNGDITTGYHDYGVMWDPQHITYYIDGQQVFQTATPTDANKPMYMLANLAVGGNWPGSPDGSNTWPADMKIDYIHAYSNDPNAQAVTPQPGYIGPGVDPTASGSSAAATAAAAPSPAPAVAAAGSSTPAPVSDPAAASGTTTDPAATSGAATPPAPASDPTASSTTTADPAATSGSSTSGDAGTAHAAGTDPASPSAASSTAATTTDPSTASTDASSASTGSSTSAASADTASTGSSSSTDPSSDTPNIPHPDAQPTPHGARDVVMADDSSGAATGGSDPNVLVATGSHQTLAGHGGDDIFVIGHHTHTAISEDGQGVSTVMTTAHAYTLPTGIDNLTGSGTGAQILTGNGLNNYITGNDGNDVITGGGGNVTIKVGTGANILNGGGAHDLFVFSDAADHGNTITDFKQGADELDLTGVLKSMNYQGQDPIADHVLSLVQNGSDTAVVVDPHANGDASAHTVVTLENVVASSLKPSHDFVWHH
jgi:beta-glucanase (GH16 family)